MEAPSAAVSRSRRQSRARCFLGIAAASIIVVVSVIVALVVTLSGRKQQSIASASIFVPLYSYPEGDNWDPLLQILPARPDVNFTIVLNPNSGPGDGTLLQADYIDSVRKLTAFRNVRTLGYVRTEWTSRNISSVLAEVATYSGWSSLRNQTSEISVSGIFFDETPSQYTSSAADYLNTLFHAVKTAPGILSERLVVHNPGTMVDPQMSEVNNDLTVVFENSYNVYNKQKKSLSDSSKQRSRYVFLIHSVPKMDYRSVRNLVRSVTQHAQYLFLTTLSRDFYHGFGSQWDAFARAVSS